MSEQDAISFGRSAVPARHCPPSEDAGAAQVAHIRAQAAEALRLTQDVATLPPTQNTAKIQGLFRTFGREYFVHYAEMMNRWTDGLDTPRHEDIEAC